MNERDKQLRMPRLVYRLRVLGLALGFLSVASAFTDRRPSAAVWIALIAYGFVWPHIAWLLARTSADPHRAERRNLVVDSAFGGVWVALMHFNLLPSVLVVAMLSMDKLGWGGRFVARTSVTMAAACLLTTLASGASFEPSTSMTVIVGSLPLMVAYPLAVAFVTNRSGRLARERKTALEEAAALREQLAHIGRVGTLGEMAAGLAHELNQPLTAIHLDANVALTLGPDADLAEMHDSLSRISEQSLRAGDIVRRMRSYAQRGQSTPERTEIAPLVQEVLALLDHDLRLNSIETTVAGGGGAPTVVADRIEIQQVLVNLIRNAIEAMTGRPATTRRLTIRIEALDGGVRVSVADTGGGVDPAILERLFHPFQSTKPRGLGLGLTICQSLIEAHGGRVGAGPHPIGGAMFFFELPAARELALS